MSDKTQPRYDSVQLVTSKAAAKVLAISPRKLWELTAAREIECIKIGRSVRYSCEALQRFVDSRKVKAAR